MQCLTSDALIVWATCPKYRKCSSRRDFISILVFEFEVLLCLEVLKCSIFVDFARPSGRDVPAVMVFPIALNGAPVLVTVDWCRQCHQEAVRTVRATGTGGKPYCSTCWDPYLKLLTPQERGDPSTEQVPVESRAPEPDFTRCKHPQCYANWRKARHYSGYCSLSCALASGWEEEGDPSAEQVLVESRAPEPDFTRCKHPQCYANWRKARHYSGHCSLSCALASGWEEEDVTEKPTKKAKNSGVAIPPPTSLDSLEIVADDDEEAKKASSGAAIPPPMSWEIVADDDAEAIQAKSESDFVDTMLANKMVRRQLENYIAQKKGVTPKAVKVNHNKTGLGYTKKGLNFFKKDSKDGSIPFVSAGILQ